MNQIVAYRILQDQGFSNENATDFLKAISENKDIAITKFDIASLRSELKTEMQEAKAELKLDIQNVRGELKDAKIEMLQAINSQTWKLFGGLTLIATLLKLADMFIK